MDPTIIAAIISAAASQLPKQGGAAPLPDKGGIDMEAKMQGIAGSMTPESKMNEAVQKADAGKNVGYPLTPMEAGQAGTGNLLTPDFGASGKDITAGAPKEGMGFDEKMQMAALVAQLGSALHGPGAPPPPGAPRGGGIGMSPVFQQMTARNIYG